MVQQQQGQVGQATPSRMVLSMKAGCWVGRCDSCAERGVSSAEQAAHFVGVEQLRKLLRAGAGASPAKRPSLRFVFVSACFSEAAAQAFIDAGLSDAVRPPPAPLTLPHTQSPAATSPFTTTTVPTALLPGPMYCLSTHC